MKDAIGSVFNLTLLFTFILIVTGFILFGINYYKAFQVKNELLTLIEKYEGNVELESFKSKAESIVNSLGYNPGSDAVNVVRNSGTNWSCVADQSWCYRKVSASEELAGTNANVKNYYEVLTFVSVDVPVINRIMARFDFFKVVGRTKAIRLR